MGMDNIGIYEIRNTLTGIRYIESSRDIRKRWWRHRRDLNRGFHHNRHLQRSWVKHGAERFDFVVLCPCLPDNHFRIEQEYLDDALDGSLYNMSKTARGGTRLGHAVQPHPSSGPSTRNRQEKHREHSSWVFEENPIWVGFSM